MIGPYKLLAHQRCLNGHENHLAFGWSQASKGFHWLVLPVNELHQLLPEIRIHQPSNPQNQESRGGET